ncbi:MAG: type 2 isopentenyl-diphosphate Delta-isomerase [Candidatus Pacebacteria bacterium]|nr:type 2 isopentenyl-diphosphate Delta-isomerase [Candidatus Paceibacterota bacterium]
MEKQGIAKRKCSHLELSQLTESQMNFDSFSGVKLPYCALPRIKLDEIDTGTELLGKKLNQPLIIASMTGGVAEAKTINANLAKAAQKTKVALGVGSQRIAVEDEKTADSFKIVRRLAPDAVIFSNMAAVQLNYGYDVDDYRRAVDQVAADALYLHLNPLQEALQLEGNTDFSDLLPKIENLVSQIGVPVYVKEVGHGISSLVAKALENVGVAGIDVAGTGGTSWSWIEATNNDRAELAAWFKNFGYTTAESLRQIKPAIKNTALVASGGIRNPIQALKSRLLGADYYSAARPFLTPALQSYEEVVKTINLWQQGLKIAMFCINAQDWKSVGY